MDAEQKFNLNMKEIISKAEIRRWGKAREKVNLQHLSPNRNQKKNKYFDEVSYPLNMFSINKMRRRKS